MRRPAPLPATPEEPAEVAQPRPQERWSRRRERSDDAPGSEADARPSSWREAPTGPRADDGIEAQPDAAQQQPTAVIDDAARERPHGIVRSRDVWRAARARRRALRAEIRRFTQRSRRRRLVWWGSIGAVAVLVLGSVVAAYSPLFAVREITVAGAKSLDPAAVQQALAEQIGSPLALVDAREVKSTLTEFPMIESYALEARPPHELLVRIVERTPIGVLQSDAGYTLVDAAGVVLSTTPQPPEGQPILRITGSSDSAAFRGAGLVVRSLPTTLRGMLTEVRASSADDVTLQLSDGKSIVWGSQEESMLKAATLERLIADRPDGQIFDVSSPTVAVVR